MGTCAMAAVLSDAWRVRAVRWRTVQTVPQHALLLRRLQ